MVHSDFTRDQFNYLDAWRGRVFDKDDDAHRDACIHLRQAYDTTKLWAEAVQASLFPEGSTETIRRLTDQWKKTFLPYNWSRIYPHANSPKGLAYTLGIDADDGFVVKIDLVDSKIDNAALRKHYEKIRGPYRESPIVALMPAEEGLRLGFSGIVGWSVDAIEKFSTDYNDIAEQLGLSSTPNTSQLLPHFQCCKDFRERQPNWSREMTQLFTRLAAAIHELGFDWWATKATNSQLVFGRKEKSAVRGSSTGILFVRKDRISVRWASFEGLNPIQINQDLSEELVAWVEAAGTRKNKGSPKPDQYANRIGYWPDEYGSEEAADTESGVLRGECALSVASTLTRNQIYYGPPGTGKTWTLQRLLEDDYPSQRFEFVTFHQSYGYEEFVEGLRPVLVNNTSDQPDAVTAGDVQYEIKKGAFVRLCERARKDPAHQYAMVIDEINRGNISKIFGELITLVEIDKREGARNTVSLTLPYSGKSFSVPSNVDVIGTMNTADRSLALVDTALRRRFEFIELMPKPAVLAEMSFSHADVKIDLTRLLTAVNLRIEALYDREHTIGHAYFTQLENVSPEQRFEALGTIFRTRVIPLLEEYFFDDWQKIRLVLGDNQKDPTHQFVHSVNSDTRVMNLFGSDHGLEDYSLRPQYRLNPKAFAHPQAYTGIYSTLSMKPSE